MTEATHTVELTAGYVDTNGQRHTRVVFGHRITAGDLFAIDESPQGQLPTQYNDLVIRAHLVEFGTLKLPVPLTVLLNLDTIDREDLADGCNIFQAISAEGRSAEFLPDNVVKLAWGFRIKESSYEQVRFGRRLTGMDEVEADRLGLKPGIRRLCFLLGRQIEKISTADGLTELEGPLPLEYFESLDGADVATLRGAAELWRQSFRLTGTHLSRNGRSTERVGTGAQDGVERTGDPQSAAGASQQLHTRAQ